MKYNPRFTFGPVGRINCEPGWSLDKEWSKRLRDFDLWFVWAGEGEMKINGSPIHLVPGICLLLCPGKDYLGIHDPENPLGVTYIHFSLTTRGRSELVLPVEINRATSLFFFDQVSTRLVNMIRNDLHPTKRAHVHHRHAELLLQCLFGELEPVEKEDTSKSGLERHHKETIDRHIQRLFETPGNAPSISELARDAGYSHDYYTRRFKQFAGTTPQEMMIRAKIERAKQLLIESPLSVGQIADALGYEDIYFFSRQFKQKTGYSPHQFRKSR